LIRLSQATRSACGSALLHSASGRKVLQRRRPVNAPELSQETEPGHAALRFACSIAAIEAADWRSAMWR
jgi:hypothetical protein